MRIQPPLPPKYGRMTVDELADAIRDHKTNMGSRLVILGHHYVQDRVIQFADFGGDSLKLSQRAAEQQDAEFVVFCGVHFMAESADILTSDDVKVVLPDLSAGCSMADMADLDEVEDAWDRLTSATDAKIIPISYVNSSAAIKAFCGRHDGACCTSSNARKVLEYALSQGDKVFFLPDQHLGRNTAHAMGYQLDAMAMYNPQKPDGGLSDEAIKANDILLWEGFCCVHQVYDPSMVEQLRQEDPKVQIIVHPECPWEIVQQADLAGSTEYIIRTVSESPEGSHWAIVTEHNLVNRLARQFKGVKSIRPLGDIHSRCRTMGLIDPVHLLWCLDEIAAGRVTNQISVNASVKQDAKLALQRMLDNVPSSPMAAK
jgi:quinolinate synthase